MEEVGRPTQPNVEGAKAFAFQAATEFSPKHWWGPITDVLGMATGLKLVEVTTSDGELRRYYVMAQGGALLLLRAASEHRDGFILAKQVVASCIWAEQKIPYALRDFASSALTGNIRPPTSKRGPQVRDRWERDNFIYRTARTLVAQFGVYRTENDTWVEGGIPSACRIIVDACSLAGMKGVSMAVAKDACSHARIWGQIEQASDGMGQWFDQYIQQARAAYGDGVDN